MKTTLLSNQKISDFCRGAALLLHAGLTLGDSLFLLAEEDHALRPALEQMGYQMDGGMPLSAAMEASALFPACATGLVQVGERTGYVEEALNALADYYQSRDRADRQIRSALAYPSLLLLLMLAVIAVLLVKVLPVFDDVYASHGGHLTGLAGGLLVFGKLLRAAMPAVWLVLGMVAICVLLFSTVGSLREKALALWRNHRGDQGISRLFNNAQFARALVMGLRSGLPLEEAVDLSGTLLVDIPGAAARCRQCSEQLREGHSLTDALSGSGLLPASSCRMLALGLQGGSGDQVMEEIACRLMDEAEAALEQKVSRVEPAMVLTASLLVGVILLSVMLPLMNIMSSIG